ncbi:Hypp1222 [Branchiostoma lanceolatum]|uniref:Hypp1222 protein n=1 Tax=Branchiostoma lanceolatum TaxID=7740 RepID=A0A8J9ZFH1_BRALA|nr:Hypp1222 [Branchiostoma lanceolatum]
MPTLRTTPPRNAGVRETWSGQGGGGGSEVISVYLRCCEIARDFDGTLVSAGDGGARSGRVAGRVTPIKSERDFVRFAGWNLLQQTRGTCGR